jgi:hypothetical protein
MTSKANASEISGNRHFQKLMTEGFWNTDDFCESKYLILSDSRSEDLFFACKK